MALSITPTEALWFAPFVLPICLYVCWTDLRAMRIYNRTVILLGLVFLLVGPFALPLSEYPWRLMAALVALILGMVANALGMMGAGDAKFITVAVPFVDPGDAGLVIMLLAVLSAAGVITHRAVRRTRLTRLAPDWESWHRGKDFPMGLALGSTLGLYLLLGLAA